MRPSHRRALLALLLLLTIVHAAPLHLLHSQQPAPRPGLPTRSAVVGSNAPPTWAFWLQQSWAAAELAALLTAAYQLWARRGERRLAEAAAAIVALKAANYQAWQVVNSAQGKGGSGGRIDALQDLSRNGVSLAGVKLDGAWLTGVALPEAQLNYASLREANLSGANLQNASLEGADLTEVNLAGADLRGAFLKGAVVSRAQLGTADLRGADLQGLRDWEAIRSASYLNIEGVLHPPPGFRAWALEHGAIEGADGQETGDGFSTHFRAV
jgi:hypothetical protein